MPQPTPLRRAVFLSVPFAAFFAVLLLTEGVLRLALPPADSLELLLAAPQQRAAFLEAPGERAFRGDPLLVWALKPNLDRVVWNLTLVSTNSQGLRYPREVGPRNPRGFRVLCLGDSVTFGFRVPRVIPRAPREFNPAAKPYPALVEEALRAANPGEDIEVIPLAVPGYTSHQGLAWLARDLERLSPDVVTACFGWNDINRRARTDRQAISMSRTAVATRRVLSQSQLAVRMGMLVRRLLPPPRPSAGGGDVMRVPSNEYVENLLAMARLGRSRGVDTVLIGPVYRDRLAHPPEGDEISLHRRALKAAAAAAEVPYLEIPELTEDAYPANASLFEEHIHPNFKGHRLMAERLLRFLAGRQLLKGLSGPP